MNSAVWTGIFTLGGVVVGGLLNWAVLTTQARAASRREMRQAARLIGLAAARIATASEMWSEDRSAIDPIAFEAHVRDPATQLARFEDVLAKLSDERTWDAIRTLQLSLDYVVRADPATVARGEWADLGRAADDARALLAEHRP